MKITRHGEHDSIAGPSEWFTGNVRIDPVFLEPEAPSTVTCAYVTFEPKARTAWHAHPVGQILIVTSGCGKVQREGGEVQEIKQGDAVRFSPDEKHWHGASDNQAMTHIAIQESENGSSAEWMEHVSDTQYKGK